MTYVTDNWQDARAHADALPKTKCNEVYERNVPHSWRMEHRVCEKPVHPEAALRELQLCGVHLNVLRKAEAETARQAEARAEQRRMAEIHKAQREVWDKQEALIEKTCAELLGVDKVNVDCGWFGSGRRGRVPTVEVPLEAFLKIFGRDPMMTPQEAVTAWQAEEDAKKVQAATGPAPF